ncbi:MAG TPA: acylphosphatase [Armatimonadota bacterium]|nr:acylphosphatase [Armatimonadota bacterium]HOS42350.1 acylphosphatase [Armatimonadota bacterium]
MHRLHAIITGRVQGVQYRAFVRRHAAALGLTGWVRNRADGSVEVVAEGDDALLAVLERLLRDGPPLARVDGVARLLTPATGAFPDFQIQREP